MSLTNLRWSWPAWVATLLATLVRVVDIVMLRRYLDEPVTVLLWIGLLFPIVLAGRVLARGREPAERSRVQRLLADLDAPALALAGFFLVLLALFYWEFARAASDGREYFVQIRSLIMDGDLAFANDSDAFGARGTASSYAFGTALLWIPFYLAAHVWLGVLNLLGADFARLGYANPYQQAVGLGSLVYGCAGLTLTFKLVSRHFSRRLAATAAVLGTAGSFLIWYLVRDNSMSHAASFFAVSLFLYLWHETRNERRAVDWAALGAAGGLMMMVRWQNAMFAVLPAADMAWFYLRSARSFNDATRKAIKSHALCGLAWVAVFSPQLVFWKSVRGKWVSLPTADHAVAWSLPPIGDVLFSADRGLFSWTPIVLVAAIGLVIMLRRQPRLAGLFLLAFAAQVYVNSTVEWGGHGFGARRFANCGPMFILGLAALLDWARRRPRLAPTLALGALAMVNLFFMAAVRSGDLPPAGSIHSGDLLDVVAEKAGDPVALPMSLWFAWRHDTDLGHYERLGAQTYNNLRINVGAGGDDRFLSSGWSIPERDAGAFRWSDGPESSLLAPLKGAPDYSLRIVAKPMVRPDGERQSVEVLVNGALIERLLLDPELREYRVSLAPGSLHRGVNRLTFRYGWVASPSSLGGAADVRLLGARFYRVELLTR